VLELERELELKILPDIYRNKETETYIGSLSAIE
jgi:hypothetical protein